MTWHAPCGRTSAAATARRSISCRPCRAPRPALLDNFSLQGLAAAVARYKGRIELEASGGINLQTVRSVAETGVDFISTDDITKSVQATDFSMRFV